MVLHRVTTYDQISQGPNNGEDEDEEQPECFGSAFEVMAAEDVAEHHKHEPDFDHEQKKQRLVSID